MRVATISFGKPLRLKVPDGFKYSIKQDGKDCIAEYEEFITEPKEAYAETAAWFLDWALSRGYSQDHVKSSWAEGTTRLWTTERGSREGLLRDIFTEIVAQLKCYLSDREVENLTRMIAVFEYDDSVDDEPCRKQEAPT